MLQNVAEYSLKLTNINQQTINIGPYKKWELLSSSLINTIVLLINWLAKFFNLNFLIWSGCFKFFFLQAINFVNWLRDILIDWHFPAQFLSIYIPKWDSERKDAEYQEVRRKFLSKCQSGCNSFWDFELQYMLSWRMMSVSLGNKGGISMSVIFMEIIDTCQIRKMCICSKAQKSSPHHGNICFYFCSEHARHILAWK